jgi:hypothetical protein
LTLEDKDTTILETPVVICHSIWRNIPADFNLREQVTLQKIGRFNQSAAGRKKQRYLQWQNALSPGVFLSETISQRTMFSFPPCCFIEVHIQRFCMRFSFPPCVFHVLPSSFNIASDSERRVRTIH